MKKSNRRSCSNVGNKFIEKPWDEGMDWAILLDIMNAHYKYLSSEFYVKITKNTFERIFGKESILSRDILKFENEAGDLIGFSGVSNISGTSSSWRLFIAILPEYYKTQLPQQVIEASILLSRNLKIEELTTYTEGPRAAPFNQAFKNLGIDPLLYLLQMHLTDFKDDYSSIIPQGVKIRNLKEIDDYRQFISVNNNAFQPVPGFQPTTIEKMKEIQDYRKKQREIEYLFTYESDDLIGFCIIEYDPKRVIGYIQSLAVHPKYQNRGIGRYLAIEAINIFKLKNCKRIELQAVTDNKNAVTLYQSLGFRSIEKMKIICYKISTSSKNAE
ncbi:GNAT family N-acetyltransferase [Promethearchaeum syntrophicum]|uniref:GNAT family N-acetyltransferase n=1 Tax=Promethearchaeum syntrophicum TaxID=2594042 RepID=A0A5B9D8R1_9ARCH|nr:GNAT family N-acetyltransferase [Candidatus Prometheoarchaeum syntrophicum]QEE15494.1 putative acetyltransferase [Candidatus Prometheoarchaeum syntrophicum]